MEIRKNVFIVLIIVTLIGLGIFNGITNIDFWNMSFYNLLTSMVAIIVAYYFTQKNNDIRKTKEKAENVLEKIQDIINQDKYYIIITDTTDKDLNMMKRTVNNKLTILEKISKEIKIEKDILYIKDRFKDYRDLIDNHIADRAYLEKSSTELKNSLMLIDDRIDEIKLKLYK